jgi:urease accessory protein
MNVPMNPAAFVPHWNAELDLAYARDGECTRPVRRRHLGPLRVQKHLYPEGPQVCQHIIIHPPAGIAGGDRLALAAQAGEHAWAQLTSPGAAKWYRADSPATQRLDLQASAGATLEWLPQETIVFSGAQARLDTRITLQGDARLCYWDVVALGRPASGEAFTSGYFQAALDIRRDGKLIWHERQRLTGNDRLLASPIGLRGKPVFATLIITGLASDDVLAQCRALPCQGEGDLTQLPDVLVARCLASEALHARDWLISLWRLLRPHLLGREAVAPRIWTT